MAKIDSRIKDHRDDTKSCIYLKEEIERLLRWGFLTKYVNNEIGKEKVVDHPPPRVEVINVIIDE